MLSINQMRMTSKEEMLLLEGVEGDQRDHGGGEWYGRGGR